MKKNKLARYFLEARNLSQIIGYYLIGGESSYNDKDGNLKMRYYFQTFNSKQLSYVPEDDVLICCKDYFKILLEVVMDCYKVFGNVIDPENFSHMKTYYRQIKQSRTLKSKLGIQKAGQLCLILQ